jgi:hypothetical protein
MMISSPRLARAMQRLNKALAFAIAMVMVISPM